MAQLTDVQRMAECLPGASIEGRTDDGEYLCAITLSLGPKKLTFRGQIKCDFDMAQRQGVLAGKARSNVRGAQASGRTTFNVQSAPSPTAKPRSSVALVFEAELPGVLAEFAQTGGAVLTNVLVAEFAKRLSEALSTTETSAGSASSTVETAPRTQSTTLSSTHLVLQVIKIQLRRMVRFWTFGRPH